MAVKMRRFLANASILYIIKSKFGYFWLINSLVLLISKFLAKKFVMTWSWNLVQSTALPRCYLFRSNLSLLYLIIVSLIILTLTPCGAKISHLFELLLDSQLTKKDYLQINVFLNLMVIEQKNPLQRKAIGRATKRW